MLKKCLILSVFFLNLSLKANENKFNFEDFKNAPKAYQMPELSADENLDKALSSVLESKNGIDSTDGNIDFESKNLSLVNLNSLYEGENISLLFQKELALNEDSYTYSGGLIQRFAKDNFLFGLNAFVDKHKEQKSSQSFGMELGENKLLKAYANYYTPTGAERNLQLGLKFILPKYEDFSFDVSRDNEKNNYKISYSPFSVFELSFLRMDYRKNDDNFGLQFNFSFNLSDNFLKQFKRKYNALDEVNRYNFLQR